MPLSNSNISATLDFSLRRGDTFFRQLTFTVNSTSEDFTGTTLKLQVRDGDAVVAEISTGTGITVTNNIVQLKITAPVTKNFRAAALSYDLQQTLANGDVKTRLAGAFIVIADVTT